MGTLWLRPNSSLAAAMVVGRPDAPSIEGFTGQIWIEGADGAPHLLGYGKPGETLLFNYNPVTDGELRVYLVTKTEDGGAEAITLADADQAVVNINRETVEPELTQATNATNTEVQIGVFGFSRYARKRKVEVSNNSDMSDAEETIYDSADYKARRLPDYIIVTREADTDALTQYVRVSHSSGGDYGPASEILEITFADEAGAGGSGGGDFTPGGRDPIEINFD